jgi:ATP-dependent helicase/nuclease subunit A
VTERVRAWVDDPVALDPPPAVGVDAVQVVTVHQAKGLEFPIVVLWDSRAIWRARDFGGAWRVGREGDGWLLKLAEIQWNDPEDKNLIELEGEYLDQERKRIIYVAATRARDFLVLPRSAPSNRTVLVNDQLAAAADAKVVYAEEPYLDSKPPAWALAVTAPTAPATTVDERSEKVIAERWDASASAAAKDRFTPTAVRTEADARLRARIEDEVVAPAKARKGRFGATFGTTVHQAIGACLIHPERTPAEAVAGAAKNIGLTEHLGEAVADVERALQALAASGMSGAVGREVFVEYPLAGGTPAGKLVGGYADLIHVGAEEIRIVDFKTDAAGPDVTGATFPEYIEQVRTYAELLAPVSGGRRVSGALLFTASGKMVTTT